MDEGVRGRHSDAGTEPASTADSTVDDPIFQVCGVSAGEILARCAQLRVLRRASGGAVGTLALPGLINGPPSGRTVWRMVDFGDGSRSGFVQAAYFVLLGRLPYETEVMQRLTRLSAGGTRLEIILRLALSREGRRREQHPVSGVLLPMILGFIRIAERIARAPLIAPTQRAFRARITRRLS
jgi:hypothetical protein